MIRRDPLSNAFIAECDTCDATAHVRGQNYFEVAFIAQDHGWTITSEVRCSSCPEPAVKSARRG